MKLLERDTVWAFLSGSDEDRFLSDISFGVACLQHLSVLDAYKAAGIATNQQLLELRRSVLKRFFEELLRATIVKLTQNTLAQRLAEKARED